MRALLLVFVGGAAFQVARHDARRAMPLAASGAEADLASLTVPELKDRLRDAGLKIGGRKAALIERLDAARGDTTTDDGAARSTKQKKKKKEGDAGVVRRAARAIGLTKKKMAPPQEEDAAALVAQSEEHALELDRMKEVFATKYAEKVAELTRDIADRSEKVATLTRELTDRDERIVELETAAANVRAEADARARTTLLVRLDSQRTELERAKDLALADAETARELQLAEMKEFYTNQYGEKVAELTRDIAERDERIAGLEASESPMSWFKSLGNMGRANSGVSRVSAAREEPETDAPPEAAS